MNNVGKRIRWNYQGAAHLKGRDLGVVAMGGEGDGERDGRKKQLRRNWRTMTGTKDLSLNRKLRFAKMETKVCEIS